MNVSFNPAVTLTFRWMGKLDLRTTIGYIVAPLIGAVEGSLPLLMWAPMGKAWPLARPRQDRVSRSRRPFLGEVITTFAMVSLLAVFLGFRRVRPFTPAIVPPLYAFMA